MNIKVQKLYDDAQASKRQFKKSNSNDEGVNKNNIQSNESQILVTFKNNSSYTSSELFKSFSANSNIDLGLQSRSGENSNKKVQRNNPSQFSLSDND